MQPRDSLPVVMIEEEDLEKAFSDSARKAALEARRAKAQGGVPVLLGTDGRARADDLLAAIDSRKTKSGHKGHNPGDPFNPEKVTSEERGIIELHKEKLSPLDISRALALDFKETRDKMKGWKLIVTPTTH